MKTGFIILLIFFVGCNFYAQERPNVLFIAIDDINDWVEPLNGNKQALTPNMDSFTKNGAMVFNNAVCAAPICGPSRSAMLSGFMPNRSGIYGNSSNMIYSDLVKENATLPEYFSKYGYHTLSNGKIFHKHAAEHGVDFGHWAFDEHARARRYNKDVPDKKFLTSSKSGFINGERSERFKSKASKLSWGPTVDTFEETVDYKVADWAKNQLEKDFDKPFFMAVGFIKPHLPWFVPKEFFDKYKLEDIKAPMVNEDDLKDILDPDGKQIHKPSGEYKWIKQHGLEKEATRAYLANISYVDACLGVILDALEKSRHADNTIVVIWGDHGWHLGEKLRYLKNTLWAEAVKPPLFVRLPGMNKTLYCERPVSLIDVYPTLVSFCNLPKKKNIDGHDFSSLLENPKTTWEYPGITVSTEGTSVLTEEWHYISNLSGAEELYDVSKDSMEWHNLISNSRYQDIVENLKKWVPKTRTKAKKIHFDKPPNYVDADADITIKSSRNINMLN
jgi:arylsulfatase A-like enzyme